MGGKKIKVARTRGRQEHLLRIRTTLEMTKVGACDVVSSESEMEVKKRDGKMEREIKTAKEKSKLIERERRSCVKFMVHFILYFLSTRNNRAVK